MNTELLFVYGTLMKDHRANGYLHGCNFLGNAVTKYNKFDMVSYYNYYPIVYPFGSKRIFGEVYEIPFELLNDLDVYEGCNNTPQCLYNRNKFDFILDNGNEVRAYMYYQKRNKENIKSKFNIIEENNTYKWR